MTDDPTSGRRRARLRTLPGGGEVDQVVRLEQFRGAHPDVKIDFRAPVWRAVVPADNSETVLTRYQLKTLLDKLAELLP